MSLFSYKEFTIADGEVILDVTDPNLPSKISSQQDINIVSISTPSAITAGFFTCFVELVTDGGFFGALAIGGDTNSINATNCGATVTDGDAEGFSFTGSPLRVKVKAVGVTGPATVFVVLTQNVG